MTTSDNVCEIIDHCNFFNELKVESILNKFKQKYCYSCKDACARYMVITAKSQKQVPDTLFPNEYDKALEILSK